ncbi:MAG: helix-turn-helix domain-containing protein [Pseudomonadota bacterium]|uniref:winged helix-turn-helix transcriptional regulator n=1 Tax=Sphingomonas sp. ERG5 TaxID=1381597 RepID=UPI000AB525EB|nr:helix-turn-helix domain-containing protein [Sphingomonas sp. ERG5]
MLIGATFIDIGDMKSFTPSRSPCPIGRASRIVGDRWALLILREAFLGAERFEQFLDRLDISRAALTSRLGILVAAGIFERVPPEGKRAVYRLTEAGQALRPTIEALRAWGDAWLFSAEAQASR